MRKGQREKTNRKGKIGNKKTTRRPSVCENRERGRRERRTKYKRER